MDTNAVIAAAEQLGGFDQEPSSLLTSMAHWGPLTQFVWLANFVVILVLVWLAFRNVLLLSRRRFDLPSARAVECRIAISKYLLLFLAAIWLLTFMASLLWIVWNMVGTDMAQRGAAWRAMMYLNTRVPFDTAFVLTVLTGIHCAVGILFAVRKSKVNP